MADDDKKLKLKIDPRELDGDIDPIPIDRLLNEVFDGREGRPVPTLPMFYTSILRSENPTELKEPEKIPILEAYHLPLDGSVAPQTSALPESPAEGEINRLKLLLELNSTKKRRFLRSGLDPSESLGDEPQGAMPGGKSEYLLTHLTEFSKPLQGVEEQFLNEQPIDPLAHGDIQLRHIFLEGKGLLRESLLSAHLASEQEPRAVAAPRLFAEVLLDRIYNSNDDDSFQTQPTTQTYQFAVRPHGAPEGTPFDIAIVELPYEDQGLIMKNFLRKQEANEHIGRKAAQETLEKLGFNVEADGSIYETTARQRDLVRIARNPSAMKSTYLRERVEGAEVTTHQVNFRGDNENFEMYHIGPRLPDSVDLVDVPRKEGTNESNVVYVRGLDWSETMNRDILDKFESL